MRWISLILVSQWWGLIRSSSVNTEIVACSDHDQTQLSFSLSGIRLNDYFGFTNLAFTFIGPPPGILRRGESSGERVPVTRLHCAPYQHPCWWTDATPHSDLLVIFWNYIDKYMKSICWTFNAFSFDKISLLMKHL